jgi:glutathionylspermidine synthase
MIDDYAAFAARITESNLVLDPWLDGAPRFRATPLILSPEQATSLASAAERLTAAYHELVTRVLRTDEGAVEDFFRLTPTQRAMLELGGSAWHGMARADLFFTDRGVATTEVNSDTPTGQAEAFVLGQLAEQHGLRDPSRRLGVQFKLMVQAYAEACLAADLPKRVGIVYPTEFPEDLPLVRLYRRWFEELGYEVVLGSPFNLKHGPDGGCELFGKTLSILWRHYKTDWWGERQAAFDDEEIEDTAPLLRELGVVASAVAARRLLVLNPFSTVLTQNKRAMAYFWERLDSFGPATQETVRAFIPPTFRAETRDLDETVADKDAWVLKSDYGAEGDEVIIGKLVSTDLFAASLRHARRGRWVLQRFFHVRPEPDGSLANYGVFVVAGQAVGIYGRVDQGLTDEHALSVPVVIRVGQPGSR